MTRIVLGVEYKGTRYFGFQSQPDCETIQSYLEKALSVVADHEVSIVCAGRTDRGVHAFGQIIHFDTSSVRPSNAWVLGANAYLPKDIVIQWAKPITEDFHARFSAETRSYRYVIYNHSVPSGVFSEYVLWIPQELNEHLMQQGAGFLLGEQDFSSFRGADCQSASPYRRVDKIIIRRCEAAITVDITANAFLLHMVRNIVGVLLRIGSGKEKPEWAKYVLDAKKRSAGGITVPPSGLYFIQAHYPEHFAIPQKNILWFL